MPTATHAPARSGAAASRTAGPGPRGEHDAIRRLQRAVGNGAMRQLLDGARADDRERADEREADRVADAATRAPASPAPAAPAPRACACGGTCATCRGGHGHHAPHHVQHHVQHHVPRSSGRPLDPATRGHMETHLGHDFGDVRVHADAGAAEAARGEGALAYTLGRDVVFGAGQYAPGSMAGRRLLAHELTHVVQQSRDGVPRVQRQPAPRQPEPSHHLRKLASSAIEALDDDEDRIVISATAAALNRGEAPAFVAILRARVHPVYGNYFVFLANYLNDNFSSMGVVGILRAFVDAGIDLMKEVPTYSLQPIVAVATFKSRVKRYRDLVAAGKVPLAEQRRVAAAIADAEAAIRAIEQPPKKVGSNVKVAGGTAGVATAAAWAWRSAAVLAADDVTLIGVADDVLIPFVVVGAAILTGIALFTSGRSITVLDFTPARAQIAAALAAMAAAIDVAVHGPRTIPVPVPVPANPPPAPRIEPPKAPKTPKTQKTPKPTKTIDVVPTPRTEPQPEPDKKRRRKCRAPHEVCATPLPIRWPSIMPLPSASRPLVRTPSGDAELEPDRRSRPQRELQEEINRARDRNVPPPRPCFDHDAEPNAPYDAHHIHPLYLGGAEDSLNLCALRTDYHQIAHPSLNDQRAMLDHPVWIACKVCDGYLPHHAGGQAYVIEGRK